LTTDLAAAAPVTVERSASTLIARYTTRRSIRSAALWGYVFGIAVASSAFSYTRIYRTPAERDRLAEVFGRDHAASALFGPAPQLQTVAGFTVFKVSMTLMIIGAVWGLMTSTRLLRGDEDAGRWEILMSGQTTRGRGAAQVLAGLGAGAAVLWAITALVTIVAGRSSSIHIGVAAGLYLALALVASAVMFLGVGAVTSQLAPSRRQAAGYAALVLGLGYGLRMVADAGTGLHWLAWTSPLGWVEQLQPLTHPHPWALVPIGAFAAVLAFLAVYLAGHRDVGTGTWPDRTARAPRLRLLFGPTGLTVRLTRSSVIWWTVAVAIAGLLMGIVAKAAGTTIAGSSVQQVLSRLGAPGSGTGTFLGIAFMIIAIVIAFETAALVNAARAEEAEGRLDHLLAAAVSRSRWFSGRLAAAAVALVLSGVAAGTFAWIGTFTQGSGLSYPTVLEAGLNTVPPAIFLLGVGALALALRPRLASAAVYVVLGWSALVELAGGFLTQNHWVLDTSLFHQMASAPAVAPDGQTSSVLTFLGLAAMIVGEMALGHRDLQGE
jgi:ABC-2 type transport system permease protein